MPHDFLILILLVLTPSALIMYSTWMLLLLLLSSNSAVATELSCSSAQAYIESFDTFTLTYFDGRGLAEVTRTIFATVGRFPGNGYTDTRLTRDEFDVLKSHGDLAKNLQRVPVLNHNGDVLGQSSTINRYLARKFGMLGQEEAEAAAIDSLCEHVNDIKSAYRKLFPYKMELTEEEKQKNYDIWFMTSATPVLEGRKERQLQWFLEKIEILLDGNGYSIGARPSLADAYLYNLLGEQAPELNSPKGEGWFQNRTGTDFVLTMFPKLNEVVSTFGSSPGMEHWLSTRGDQNW